MKLIHSTIFLVAMLVLQASFAQNLKVYYPFSGNANDASGNNINPTYVGSGVTLTADRFGQSDKAYAFSGASGAYMRMPADMLPTENRTVSLWLKTSNVSPAPTLLGYGGNGGPPGTSYLMILNEAGGQTFQAQAHFGTNRLTSPFAAELYGTWVHWVVTINGTTQKFFINGQPVATGSFSSPTVVTGKDLSLGVAVSTFGMAPYTDVNIGYFNGSLDEVRIYDDAMSDAQVLQLYQLESAQPNPGPFYVNDNSTTGDSFTTATGNDTNPGTAAAPFATIQHAVTVAPEGSIIYVDAGSYVEQVTINKGLTITGAGRNITFVTLPETTAPAPGPFTEEGTFQTTQGIADVHIANLSVTGKWGSGPPDITPIILQTGGSVRNSNLQGGNQGVFFRVQTAAKTAEVEGNIINAEFIGVNFEGQAITASLINNEISVNNTGFSAGVFANGGATFTATGNKISNYVTAGISGGSITTVNNNSFAGAGGFAIQAFGTANATCNWFGAANEAAVASQISGNVSYTPWLTNGADAEPGTIGFQPVQDACDGRPAFYVNDNSTTDDAFTTAVGNNANPGTIAAPFATIQHAVTLAPEGSIIFVDAGNYVEQVTITKGLTITGAGRSKSFVTLPATTAPAPGPFAEQGTFQTTQGIGDVHISDLSITGQWGTDVPAISPIILQTGGSVLNCNLQDGNQGVFFRIESAVKTALIGNSTINAEFIGINVQGSGLTASLLNNEITVSNPGFSAGVFAGLDFGWLPSFTAIGNNISGFTTYGLYANSSNGSVTQNSIAGSGLGILTNAASLLATCNWWGSASEESVAGKVSGTANYTPWLLDGTDAAPETAGFQPVANACFGGREFYVNDNNTTGDVFTTAIGNDANPGTSGAPFATIQHAFNTVPAGSRVYVDAGFYNISDLTINKSIYILGSNYEINPNEKDNMALYNRARNEETILAGGTFFIGSSNIQLSGFLMMPGSKSAIRGTNGTWTNITVDNCLFEVQSTANSVTTLLLHGNSSMPLQAGNISIRQNRFDKYDVYSGTNIDLRDLHDVDISRNAMVVSGTANRTQAGILLGNTSQMQNTGRIIGAIVAGNYINNTTAAINLPKVSNCNILNNTLINGSSSAIQCFYGNTDIEQINITNNYIEDFIGLGVAFRGANSLAKLSDINIDGNTIKKDVSKYINLNFNAPDAQISVDLRVIERKHGHFSIRNNSIELYGDYGNAATGSNKGIQISGQINTAEILNNEISFMATGAKESPSNLPPVPTGIYVSTEWSATYGQIPADAVIDIYNNSISGFSNSIAFYDQASTGTATPETGYGYLLEGVVVNIENNSFANDSISINNGEVGEKVNASCNWYGTVDAAIIATKVSANVNYTPWLTNGTDADPATTGFQPLPDVCNGTPVVAILVSQNNISCFGGNNGSADVSISGGVLPYTTAWSSEGDAAFTQNGEDLMNAPAGNYTLLVTDAVGATATVQVSLQEPTQLAGLVSGTNVTCFGAADGTASIEVNGGVPPYTYLWSNGSETATISSLLPGTYSVTATDANGCTVTGSYTVIQPAAVNPAISVTNISCAGAANGQIALTGRAGVAPYMYSLDGITYQESNVFANLTAGNYTGYVMDANGCAGTVNATITEPLPLVVVPTSVTGTCTGTSNGAIDVTVSGGTTRYNFAWTGPNAFTSTREDLTKVAAGMYTLVVTDANGCTATLAVEVIASPAIVITGIVSPVTCFSTLTGAIDVSVSGGSGNGYTFVWSGPNGYKASTEDVSGLRAGNYTVTVTDAGGCSGSEAFTVTQPASAPTVTATKIDIIACDALGSVTAIAAGGTAPYQYSLDGGPLQSANIFPGLPVGSYTIQATDANGCTTALISVSIVDNGDDAYEPNNTVSAAVNINVGSAIRARLAAAKGTDVDWYQFTAAATGSYSLSWSHPSVEQSFDLYTLSRNKAVLVAPSSISGNVKEYNNLTAGTVYLVQVSGTQSFVCYDLLVSSSAPIITAASQPHESSATAMKTAKSIAPSDLTARVFPNPHSGNFTIEVQSPVSGMGSITLFDLSGRALAERKVLLQKGSNTVRFENLRPLSMVYRVIVDSKVVTGKVIGIH